MPAWPRTSSAACAGGSADGGSAANERIALPAVGLSPLSARILFAQGLRERYQRVFCRARGYSPIGPQQSHRAFGLEQGKAATAVALPLRLGTHSAEKEHYRDLEEVGNLLQPSSRDAVGSLFVLLDLLEGQTDAVR